MGLVVRAVPLRVPVLPGGRGAEGKRVAFLGVDTDDSDAAARDFLDELPLPYPSISDPGRDIFDEYRVRFGLPATAFYDADGKLVYVKQGPYESEPTICARTSSGTRADVAAAG